MCCFTSLAPLRLPSRVFSFLSNNRVTQSLHALKLPSINRKGSHQNILRCPRPYREIHRQCLYIFKCVTPFSSFEWCSRILFHHQQHHLKTEINLQSFRRSKFQVSTNPLPPYDLLLRSPPVQCTLPPIYSINLQNFNQSLTFSTHKRICSKISGARHRINKRNLHSLQLPSISLV